MNTERNTQKRHSGNWMYPVAAGAIIYAGALVVLEAGYAKPGKAATGLIAVGRANITVNNAGGFDGSAMVEVEEGVFHYANKADDPVTQADVCKPCYIVNDETVSKSDGGGTRSLAGVVRAVDDSGVWVQINP